MAGIQPIEFNIEPLVKTNIILASLSLLGSLTIIILYSFRKNLRSFVFNLVFYLAISELLNSIGNMLSINKLYQYQSDIICYIQSGIINYTDFCSLTWMCIISYTIYELMINFNQNVTTNRYRFIIIGFSTPLIFSLIYGTLFFLNLNNNDETVVNKKFECWCWLSDIEKNWICVVIIYICYWFLIAINFAATFKVIKFLKSNCDPDDKFCWKIKRMCNKLYMYPLISAFCFLFATVHRMYEIFYFKNTNIQIGKGAYRLEIVLYLLHGMFINFRGFLFFLVYGCDNKVRREFKYFCEKIKRIFIKKKRGLEVNEPSI